MRAWIDLVETKLAAGDLTFRDEMRGWHHGQSDLTLSAYLDGKMVGYIEYCEYQGEPSIEMIEVTPEQRRRGIAKALLHRLQARYPGREVAWGWRTDDGRKLEDGMTFQDVPVFNVARYRRLKQAAKELRQRLENAPPDEATRRGWEKWQRLDDLIEKIERSEAFAKPTKRLMVPEVTPARRRTAP